MKNLNGYLIEVGQVWKNTQTNTSRHNEIFEIKSIDADKYIKVVYTKDGYSITYGELINNIAILIEDTQPVRTNFNRLSFLD
jgi:hypothetical protein